jgi:hypothetical protein
MGILQQLAHDLVCNVVANASIRVCELTLAVQHKQLEVRTAATAAAVVNQHKEDADDLAKRVVADASTRIQAIVLMKRRAAKRCFSSQFASLWQRGSLKGFPAVETVVFDSSGQPSSWFFTSKRDDSIKRKLPSNTHSKAIYSRFCSDKGADATSQLPVALLLWCASSTLDAQVVTTHVRHLTAADLKHWLFDAAVSDRANCVLQRWLPPVGTQNELIQVRSTLSTLAAIQCAAAVIVYSSATHAAVTHWQHALCCYSVFTCAAALHTLTNDTVHHVAVVVCCRFKSVGTLKRSHNRWYLRQQYHAIDSQ